MKSFFLQRTICLGLLVFTTPLFAQAPRAVQQAEQLERQRQIQAPKMELKRGQLAPELYPGESEDVGPQRILRLKPRRTLFEVVADSQYFWSDNVLLAGANETESTIFVNTIQAAVAPSGLTLKNRDIAPRIGVRAQWFNYGLDGSDNGLGVFDFHSETAFAEGRYHCGNNWHLSLGFEATRLTDQGNYDEFYRELAPTWAVQKFFPIGHNKLIAANYRGFYRFTETDALFTPRDINDRTDHSLALSYSHELFPRFLAQPFYRFQYTYYTGSRSRHDTLHTVGMTLSYHFAKWASLRTTASYEIKDSGDETILTDYEKLDVGLGASLVFRF